MAVSNHLLLSTKAEEDSKDDLLSALSNIAYSMPAEPEQAAQRGSTPVEPPRKKRNRFFYMPTSSFFDDVQERKKETQPTPAGLEYVNQEVEERVAGYRKELPPSLADSITAVREFFLKEVDPLVLGVQGGLAQAQDVVQKTLDSAVDPMPFAQFERMVAHARLYKMAAFIVKYMKLPKSAMDDLLYAVQPKKEVMIIGPNTEEQQQRGPRRHERIAEATERNRREAAILH
jgi:hypothetical protein